ncbi:MAG TPA: hypothetical protein VIB00_10940 [Pyrinomonadaceae bacterium]|jgi:uncharacterized membrane protein
METKKTKYDTNPLDPDFVRQTDEVWGEDDQKPETQEGRGATKQVTPSPSDNARSNVYSEAPTRRIDDPPLDAPYPSVFVPPSYTPPPAPIRPPQPLYQQAPHPPASQQPSSRTVPGIGLPEKWAAMLPYAPFYIGVVVSLLDLLLVPRQEVRVRFHAAQGLSLHIAMLAIQTIFGVIGSLTDSSLGGSLFSLASTIFLIISMVRVWKGEPHRIAPLADPSQWFNQRIEPRKSQ